MILSIFIIHSYSSPPNKVSITFSSQKERQDWEHTLHSLQLSLPKQQDTSSSSSTSTYHQKTHTDPPNTALPQFMWHVTLPSCRVGSEVRQKRYILYEINTVQYMHVHVHRDYYYIIKFYFFFISLHVQYIVCVCGELYGLVCGV